MRPVPTVFLILHGLVHVGATPTCQASTALAFVPQRPIRPALEQAVAGSKPTPTRCRRWLRQAIVVADEYPDASDAMVLSMGTVGVVCVTGADDIHVAGTLVVAP